MYGLLPIIIAKIRDFVNLAIIQIMMITHAGYKKSKWKLKIHSKKHSLLNKVAEGNIFDLKTGSTFRPDASFS